MSFPPAGPDVTFELDERGLVEASPDGALTPGGITVFAAEPPNRPPERPPAPPSADAPAPDPRLANARPRARPVPSSPAEAAEAAEPEEPEPAALAAEGATDAQPEAVAEVEADPAEAELAASDAAPATGWVFGPGGIDARPPVRPASAEAEPEVGRAATGFVFGPGGIETQPAPRPRTAGAPVDPDAIDAALASAAETAAGASLFRPSARPDDPAAAAEEEEVEQIPGSSVYAVVRSMRPGDRPEGFAAATAAVRERTESLRASAPAPATPAAAAPTIPTAASVARTATQDNAIRLRNLNLIGVYGSTASPRALVRLPSGRYQRVRVGDRLDGGRVQAIQGDRLQYVKNGRAIVLEVPGA